MAIIVTALHSNLYSRILHDYSNSGLFSVQGHHQWHSLFGSSCHPAFVKSSSFQDCDQQYNLEGSAPPALEKVLCDVYQLAQGLDLQRFSLPESVFSFLRPVLVKALCQLVKGLSVQQCLVPEGSALVKAPFDPYQLAKDLSVQLYPILETVFSFLQPSVVGLLSLQDFSQLLLVCVSRCFIPATTGSSFTGLIWVPSLQGYCRYPSSQNTALVSVQGKWNTLGSLVPAFPTAQDTCLGGAVVEPCESLGSLVPAFPTAQDTCLGGAVVEPCESLGSLVPAFPTAQDTCLGGAVVEPCESLGSLVPAFPTAQDTCLGGAVVEPCESLGSLVPAFPNCSGHLFGWCSCRAL